MYTKKITLVIKDEEVMTPKNSLAAIKEADAIKAVRVVTELRIACSKYSDSEMMGKVISFEYGLTNISCWAKIIEVFPTSGIYKFIPTTAENTSPRLTNRLQIKFL